MNHTETARPKGWRTAAKRVAPFLLLGPISGPLVAGVVLNYRDGRRVLAAMYAVLLVELTLLAGPLTAGLLANLTARL